MATSGPYDPEVIFLMRNILAEVIAKVPQQHRTSSNQAAIASRILSTAALGRRSEAALMAEALDEVKIIFAGPQSARRLQEDVTKVFDDGNRT